MYSFILLVSLPLIVMSYNFDDNYSLLRGVVLSNNKNDGTQLKHIEVGRYLDKNITKIHFFVGVEKLIILKKINSMEFDRIHRIVRQSGHGSVQHLFTMRIQEFCDVIDYLLAIGNLMMPKHVKTDGNYILTARKDTLHFPLIIEKKILNSTSEDVIMNKRIYFDSQEVRSLLNYASELIGYAIE